MGRIEERRLVQRCGGASARCLGALLLAALVGAVGCSHHHHHRGVVPAHPHAKRHGPPPHAPAHGYRHKHHVDGVELVYDADLAVYVVTGHAAVYWDGVRYVRWLDGAWHMSARFGGAWLTVGRHEIPARLVARHTGKHRKAKKKRGRGHGPPAKHAY